MTEKLPLITIGITCHNAGNSIARAINCAQKQTWENIEILVVDDGSADSSVVIVKALAEKDSKIRLIIHEENKGTAVARTTLAENAKGDFLCFFDDDDESLPERLEKQYARLIAYEKMHNTDMVFCYCGRYVVRPDGTRSNKTGHGIGRVPPEPHGPEIADILLWNKGPDTLHQQSYAGQMGSGTLMLRTAIFNKIGYFDERFRRAAEIDLAIRAGLEGAHFISVNDPLIVQYKTMSDNKAGRKPLEYALLLREKNKEYLKQNRVYRASIAIAYSKFYKRNKPLTFFYFFLACLASPDKVLAGFIKRRLLTRSQPKSSVAAGRV